MMQTLKNGSIFMRPSGFHESGPHDTNCPIVIELIVNEERKLSITYQNRLTPHSAYSFVHFLHHLKNCYIENIMFDVDGLLNPFLFIHLFRTGPEIYCNNLRFELFDFNFVDFLRDCEKFIQATRIETRCYVTD